MGDPKNWLATRKKRQAFFAKMRRILGGSLIAAVIIGPLVYFSVCAIPTTAPGRPFEGPPLREAPATPEPELEVSEMPIPFPERPERPEIKRGEELGIAIREEKIPQNIKQEFQARREILQRKDIQPLATVAEELPEDKTQTLNRVFANREGKVKSIKKAVDGTREELLVMNEIDIDFGPENVQNNNEADGVARNALQNYLQSVEGGENFAVLKDTRNIDRVQKPEQLVLQEIKENAGKWYVTFRQFHQGLPVFDGSVKMIFTNQKKLITVTDNIKSNLPEPTEFRAGRALVSEKAKELFEWDDQYDTIEFIDKGYFGQKPAYKVDIEAHNPLGQWEIFVDGVDAQVRDIKTNIRQQDAPTPNPAIEEGATPQPITTEAATEEPEIEILETFFSRVLGKIYPKTPADTQTVEPMANEYVYISGQQQQTTDEEGYFENPQQQWYSLFLDGPYVTVHDDSATTNVEIINENPEDPFTWDENSASLASINSFYHVNKMHEYFANNHNFNLDKNIPLTVNSELVAAYLNGCGAWFNNDLKKIEMGTGGTQSCPEELNYALSSDVVYHEYSHFVIEEITHLPNIYGAESAALGEGLADYFAATINNDPVWGDVVSPNRTRNLDNTLQYDADMLGQSHHDGQIFSGALWDLRQEIGAEATDRLVFNTLYQDRLHFETFMYGMIIEDDDNDDFSDGTPNLIAIIQAFENHGIGPGVENFDGLPITPEEWSQILEEQYPEGEEEPFLSGYNGTGCDFSYVSTGLYDLNVYDGNCQVWGTNAGNGWTIRNLTVYNNTSCGTMYLYSSSGQTPTTTDLTITGNVNVNDGCQMHIGNPSINDGNYDTTVTFSGTAYSSASVTSREGSVIRVNPNPYTGVVNKMVVGTSGDPDERINMYSNGEIQIGDADSASVVYGNAVVQGGSLKVGYYVPWPVSEARYGYLDVKGTLTVRTQNTYTGLVDINNNDSTLYVDGLENGDAYTGATINNNGDFRISGDMHLYDSNAKIENSYRFYNSSGTDAILDNGASIINTTSSSTYDANLYNPITLNDSSYIENSGYMDIYDPITMNNTSYIKMTAGDITSSYGITLNGSSYIDQDGGNLSPGAVEVYSGTAYIDKDGGTFSPSSLTFTLSGAHMDQDGSGSTSVANDVTVKNTASYINNNSGTFTVGGNLIITNSGTVDNKSGATFDVNTSVQIGTSLNADGKVLNAGTFEVYDDVIIGSGGGSYNNSYLKNTGGTFTIDGSATNELYLHSTTGSNYVSITGGTLDVGSTSPSSSSDGITRVYRSSEINNSGTFKSNRLLIGLEDTIPGGTFNNQTGGTIHITGSYYTTVDLYRGSLNNQDGATDMDIDGGIKIKGISGDASSFNTYESSSGSLYVYPFGQAEIQNGAGHNASYVSILDNEAGNNGTVTVYSGGSLTTSSIKLKDTNLEPTGFGPGRLINYGSIDVNGTIDAYGDNDADNEIINGTTLVQTALLDVSGTFTVRDNVDFTNYADVIAGDFDMHASSGGGSSIVVTNGRDTEYLSNIDFDVTNTFSNGVSTAFGGTFYNYADFTATDVEMYEDAKFYNGSSTINASTYPVVSISNTLTYPSANRDQYFSNYGDFDAANINLTGGPGNFINQENADADLTGDCSLDIGSISNASTFDVAGNTSINAVSGTGPGRVRNYATWTTAILSIGDEAVGDSGGRLENGDYGNPATFNVTNTVINAATLYRGTLDCSITSCGKIINVEGIIDIAGGLYATGTGSGQYLGVVENQANARIDMTRLSMDDYTQVVNEGDFNATNAILMLNTVGTKTFDNESGGDVDIYNLWINRNGTYNNKDGSDTDVVNETELMRYSTAVVNNNSTFDTFRLNIGDASVPTSGGTFNNNIGGTLTVNETGASSAQVYEGTLDVNADSSGVDVAGTLTVSGTTSTQGVMDIAATSAFCTVGDLIIDAQGWVRSDQQLIVDDSGSGAGSLTISGTDDTSRGLLQIDDGNVAVDGTTTINAYGELQNNSTGFVLSDGIEAGDLITVNTNGYITSDSSSSFGINNGLKTYGTVEMDDDVYATNNEVSTYAIEVLAGTTTMGLSTNTGQTTTGNIYVSGGTLNTYNASGITGNMTATGASSFINFEDSQSPVACSTHILGDFFIHNDAQATINCTTEDLDETDTNETDAVYVYSASPGGLTEVEGTLIINTNMETENMTVGDGTGTYSGLITHDVADDTWDPSRTLVLKVTDTLQLRSNGSIDVSGKSYIYDDYLDTRGRGGTYGGKGQYLYSEGTPDVEFGNNTSYLAHFGRIGTSSQNCYNTGMGQTCPGANGGGIINLRVGVDSDGDTFRESGSLVLDAGSSILAHGDDYLDGAGSGGSINVVTYDMSGSGEIIAHGGNSTSASYDKTAGGGGRVYIDYYDKSNYTGSVGAFGGTNTDGYEAGTGTIFYLWKDKWQNQNDGTLVIDGFNTSDIIDVDLDGTTNTTDYDDATNLSAIDVESFQLDRYGAVEYYAPTGTGGFTTVFEAQQCIRANNGTLFLLGTAAGGYNRDHGTVNAYCIESPDPPDTLYVNNSSTGAQSGLAGDKTVSPPPSIEDLTFAVSAVHKDAAIERTPGTVETPTHEVHEYQLIIDDNLDDVWNTPPTTPICDIDTTRFADNQVFAHNERINDEIIPTSCAQNLSAGNTYYWKIRFLEDQDNDYGTTNDQYWGLWSATNHFQVDEGGVIQIMDCTAPSPADISLDIPIDPTIGGSTDSCDDPAECNDEEYCTVYFDTTTDFNLSLEKTQDFTHTTVGTKIFPDMNATDTNVDGNGGSNSEVGFRLGPVTTQGGGPVNYYTDPDNTVDYSNTSVYHQLRTYTHPTPPTTTTYENETGILNSLNPVLDGKFPFYLKAYALTSSFAGNYQSTLYATLWSEP
jgi:hypothetical protein